MITIDLFIPSYHRPDNIKTLRIMLKLGWDVKHIWVIIDSEADDKAEYEAICAKYGCHLEVFDMGEARKRYDYVHRPSVARRSCGQARNMFQDIARKYGINFYIVQDDDTIRLEYKPFAKYKRAAISEDLFKVVYSIKDMMERRKIGLFGLSQTGDCFQVPCTKLIRYKVMNFSFYYLPYIYRGERGVQDEDTSMYVGLLNEGYFTGSCADGLVLGQMPSAQQKGGLTDLYKENKLVNKALVCPIQFPSAIWAERQVMNGGRLHHRIDYRYLMPKVMKGTRSNIEWDAYPEDVPFTNEPKRE